MAYLPEDLQEVDIVSFKGSTQAVDPYQIDLSHALLSQNIDFLVTPNGNVIAMGRRGTSLVAAASAPDQLVWTISSWYFTNAGTPDCWVLMLAKDNTLGILGPWAWKQSSQTLTNLLNVSGTEHWMTTAFNGVQAYLAFAAADGITTGHDPALVNVNFSTADELFARSPLGSCTVTFGTANTGDITQGAHLFSFIYTTRNGFVGVFNDQAINGFDTVSATAPDGTRNATLTFFVSTDWSDYPTLIGGTIQVVMTTAANLARIYAVPGAIATIPSSGSTLAVTFSINDGDLTATGTDVTEYPNNFQHDLTPLPTISAVFTFSSRLGLIGLDSAGFPVIYFSEPNNYQQMNAAYYGVYLESRQIPVQGCSIGSNCYIATLSALYTCGDNGGQPVTWTPPARIDGSVGILSPSCITVSGGRLILASEKGLFVYRGGTFPLIPMSYYQAPDWNRINWLSPTQVQVVDDGFDRVIRVIAPLKVVVTAATNTNPIIVTTAILINGAYVPYPHNFQTGLSVTIAGVTGNTAANTTQNITVLSDTTFSIPVAGNGNYSPTEPPFATATPNSPNAEMSWNYSIGEDPDSVMYSLNSFGSFLQSAIGIVRNIRTNVDEPWYATPGILGRRVLPTDASIHQDIDNSGSAAAIKSTYKTSQVPDPAQSIAATFSDFHGAHIKVGGQGGMAIAVQGVTNEGNVTKEIIPARSPVIIPPSKYGVANELLIKWFLRSEQETIQLTTDAIGEYFILSFIRAYWNPSLPF